MLAQKLTEPVEEHSPDPGVQGYFHQNFGDPTDFAATADVDHVPEVIGQEIADRVAGPLY